MSNGRLVRMSQSVSANFLKSLERVKGIEPSSSAWKSLAAAVISRPVPTKRPKSGSLSANDYSALSEHQV
jgi:hypothetical protein